MSEIASLLLAALLALLQVADWWTTRRVIARGGRELNPVMAAVIARLGMNGLLAVKLAGAALIAWLAVPRGMWWALAALDLFYAWVAWRNWRLDGRLRSADEETTNGKA